MEQIVLIIHIFVAIGLISFVLMQRSEGGGTGFGGSSGSMTGFLSSRSKATILTKMTSYLAAAFICTSLLLAVLASRANEAETFKVRIRKLDPYLNYDPGTMSPYQHGEVFVTDDGAETDLDLGHYERFTGVSSKKSDNVTTGKIYSNVISKERKGEYLGATVQVIPHITDEIKAFISSNLSDEDFVICEIGGTVGDIEAQPYLEAIRQFRNEIGYDRTLFRHLTLLPYIPTTGELKTKPTQHSVKELLSMGIQPNILLCRCDRDIPEIERNKIALFCNLPAENVIAAKDASCLYEVPINYHHDGLDTAVLNYFNIKSKHEANLKVWEDIVSAYKTPEKKGRIGIVGKYTSMLDCYKSLYEALIHAGLANHAKVECEWIEASDLTSENVEQRLELIDGILVPGGFGERGINGKLIAIQYAREKQIPYFGICLGMQLAVIEFARNIVGITDADSSEMKDNPKNPIIGLMTEWEKAGTKQKRSKEGDLGCISCNSSKRIPISSCL